MCWVGPPHAYFRLFLTKRADSFKDVQKAGLKRKVFSCKVMD